MAFVVVGISACGKTGKLETVKTQETTNSDAHSHNLKHEQGYNHAAETMHTIETTYVMEPARTPVIDEPTQAVVVTPELDILPYNSK